MLQHEGKAAKQTATLKSFALSLHILITANTTYHKMAVGGPPVDANSTVMMTSAPSVAVTHC